MLLMNRLGKAVSVLTLSMLMGSFSVAATRVLQRGYSPDVAGATLQESILTPTNVTPTTFGRLFSLPVDGTIYAQPLYVPALNMSDNSVHNVVFVATMKDSVYAFDADNPGSPLWSINYTYTTPGASPVPATDYTKSGLTLGLNITGAIGIESTPVIDPTSNTLYFVTNSREADTIVFRLHAVDIKNGAERSGSPVLISGQTTVAGKTLQFNAAAHNQRASLTIAKGQVIVAFASHEDIFQYYGWVMAYNASTLKQTGIFNPAPTIDHGAAIWQSGRPPVVDKAGNVYLFTGNAWGLNGSNLTADGVNNFAESVIKLDPAQGLKVVDYFTPANYQQLDAADKDLSSSGPALIPGSNFLIGGGKIGTLYVLNSQNLGKLQANDAGALQTVAVGKAIFTGPVVWPRSTAVGGPVVFNSSIGDNIKAYASSGPTLNIQQIQASTISPGFPGGVLTLSANGDNQGILWGLFVSAGRAVSSLRYGELHALNASNLSQDLWSSINNAKRDDFGLIAKFVPPVVANGKVYIATSSNQLVVYGLLPSNGGSITVWPARQSVLDGKANFVVNAMNTSGNPVAGVSWSISGLPVGATGNFLTNAQGQTVLQIKLNINSKTPQGSYRLYVTGSLGSKSLTQSVLLDVPDAIAIAPTAIQVDSQSASNSAIAAIDGNPATFWTTDFSSTSSKYPHYAILDLGTSQPVSGVSLLPAQNGCGNGLPMQYKIYVTDNNDVSGGILGNNFISNAHLAADGSFDYGADGRSYTCDGATFPPVQNISFPAVKGRYLTVILQDSLIANITYAAAAEITPYIAKGTVPIAGNYILSARHSGLVIDGSTGAATPGTLVTQQPYLSLTDQQWHIWSAPLDGYSQLANLYSLRPNGQYTTLEVFGNSNKVGTALDQAINLQGTNQQFKLLPVGDGRGYYAVSSKSSGMCASVLDNSLLAGAGLGQFPCSDSSYNQNWWLTPANPKSP